MDLAVFALGAQIRVDTDSQVYKRGGATRPRGDYSDPDIFLLPQSCTNWYLVKSPKTITIEHLMCSVTGDRRFRNVSIDKILPSRSSYQVLVCRALYCFVFSGFCPLLLILGISDAIQSLRKEVD